MIERTSARGRRRGIVLLAGLALAVAGAESALAERATAVAAGGSHTCALTSEGSVRCWGHNQQGQLGDGTTEGSGTPGPVSVLSQNVVAIASGDAATHTCAIVDGGFVWCWGSNDQGQLGNGTTTSSSVPVAVSGLDDATALAMGGYHTCAVTPAGPVCWGANYLGQLGDSGASGYSSSLPVAVSGLSGGIAGLAAGGDHTCALESDGTAHCWGSNDRGEVGDGYQPFYLLPRPVTGFAASVPGPQIPAVIVLALALAAAARSRLRRARGSC